MLIPSIDLLGGKIAQLIQGEKKALEFADPEPWVQRFAKYPLVQLIDLDAAKGTGNNRLLLRQLSRRLSCQVGGGIRTIETAQAVLADGAQRVIIGSALVKHGSIDLECARQFAAALSSKRLIFAVDSRANRVVTQGWRKATLIRPAEMISALEQWCSGFLYTHVDTEGLMQGIPFDAITSLRSATSKKLMGGTVEPTLFVRAAIVMGIVVGIACAAAVSLVVGGLIGTVLGYVVSPATAPKEEAHEKA